VGSYRLVPYGSGEGPVTGSSEHGNEFSDFDKRRVIS
jgi:hypothetical protein